MDFLPTLPVFAAYVAAVLVITFTPGPGHDAVPRQGGDGRAGRPAWRRCSAPPTGILIHTTLVALGLSALLAASATAFFVLKVVGALYLLWLAVEAVRHGSALNLDAARPQPGEPLFRVVAEGAGRQPAQPEDHHVLRDLPAAIRRRPAIRTRRGKLLFLGVVFVVIATPICVAMIVSASRLAHLLKRSPRVMRAIDWLFAGVFGAFAVRLLLTQRH